MFEYLAYFMPFVYMLGTAVFMALTWAMWKVMSGEYHPAQYVMNIFVQRRLAAEANREAAQLRLERARLDKSVS